MPDIRPFFFGEHEVRALTDAQGNPWFVAADLGEALGVTNVRQNLDKLDDDERGVCNAYTSAGTRELSTVSESGLYFLIIRSRTEKAKRFRRWVTGEVLPSLRKNGRYEMPQAEPAPALPPAPEPEAPALDTAVPEAVSAAHFGLRESLRLKLIGEARQLAGNDWSLFDAMYVRLCNRLTDGRAPLALAGSPASQAHQTVQAWMDDRLEADAQAVCRATELYRDFLAWCRLRGHRPLMQKSFGAALTGQLDRIRSGNVYYKGVRLKEAA